ncbi:SAM-dependent methyltransferase [Roseibacterium sp. SDUM158017]|uniref:class I SAM-dependent methyltransferase n=1 Tax=Roseicyclus salinarum TaxID=3036773 RepID=UPI0024156CAB|nr:SAM-dependent methyltransferase [Roseibacterium sp. SDUM158017]MDG4648329.1 SAM-dependent methyltransferase [Roseibacterium sp. SDUM158017]
MTPLKARLVQRIGRTGPMTLADYMTECLLHPEHGYYTRRDPLGRAGDFVTAPEISQMFGELLGLCLAQTWMDHGAPGEFALVELGPGRGTLMADALRATAGVPGFHDALRLHLVEASPHLRTLQAETLAGAAPQFHDTLDTIPDLPLLLVANEFFDALPIRQFQRAGGPSWRERVVGVRDDDLVLGLAPPGPVAALEGRLADTHDGQIVEHNAPAEAIAAAIGERIARRGGAALIVDYGDTESIGDTFQAIAAHAHADPFHAPGEADLTAHVAFGPIARAAAPAKASPLVTQGVFLERLGVTGRARALARRLEGEALDAHVAAHRRLTHPDEMGNLFKLLAIVPEGSSLPPGFAD